MNESEDKFYKTLNLEQRNVFFILHKWGITFTLCDSDLEEMIDEIIESCQED